MKKLVRLGIVKEGDKSGEHRFVDSLTRLYLRLRAIVLEVTRDQNGD